MAVVSCSDVMIRARRALLDALVALEPHREALVLVGAQAVYLHTGDTDVAIATTTKDSDLAVIPDKLGRHPLLNELMEGTGFHRDLQGLQGQWFSKDGVPVELLVPAGLEPSGRRGARIPPHDKQSALRVPGLEAAAVDHEPRTIGALEPGDDRTFEINVAGPAALLVAKAHKLGERLAAAEAGGRDRTEPKDAHDVYRLLKAAGPDSVRATLEGLLVDDVSAEATHTAIGYLRRYGDGPEAPVCVLAGRAEADSGDPQLVAAQTHELLRSIIEGSAL